MCASTDFFSIIAEKVRINKAQEVNCNSCSCLPITFVFISLKIFLHFLATIFSIEGNLLWTRIVSIEIN